MTFIYEHNYQMSEEENERLYRVFCRLSKTRKYVLFFLLGIAALFSTWTFILGCCLIVSVILRIFTPSILKSASKSSYHQLTDRQKPVTYRVTEEGLTFIGDSIEASCKWSNLVQWRELDDWLILSLAGLPTVFFPIAGLKEAGVYDPVKNLCRENGVDYNNPNKNKPNHH